MGVLSDLYINAGIHRFTLVQDLLQNPILGGDIHSDASWIAVCKALYDKLDLTPTHSVPIDLFWSESEKKECEIACAQLFAVVDGPKSALSVALSIVEDHSLKMVDGDEARWTISALFIRAVEALRVCQLLENAKAADLNLVLGAACEALIMARAISEDSTFMGEWLLSQDCRHAKKMHAAMTLWRAKGRTVPPELDSEFSQVLARLTSKGVSNKIVNDDLSLKPTVKAPAWQDAARKAWATSRISSGDVVRIYETIFEVRNEYAHSSPSVWARFLPIADREGVGSDRDLQSHTLLVLADLLKVMQHLAECDTDYYSWMQLMLGAQLLREI